MRTGRAAGHTGRTIEASCEPSRGRGDGEEERRPFVGLAFGPDAPAVALHDPLRQRQADSASLELVGAMQALEHAEQLFDEAHVEAHAVVADVAGDLPVPRLRADLHPPVGPAPAE